MTGGAVRTGSVSATALLVLAVGGLICNVLFRPAMTDVPFALVFVTYGLVGWLIARSDPTNSVAWLLLAFAGIGGLHAALWAWTAAATSWGLPGSDIAEWSQSWLWAPMLGVTFGPLLVLFPDGRLMSPRWRVVLWLSGAFVILAVAGNAFFPYSAAEGGPNPYAIHGHDALLRLVQNLAGLALMGSLIGGVAALVVRYRRAGTTQRQQLKWFLTAAALLPVAVVTGELDQQALQPVVVPLSLSFLAAAIGIAILRHGLYDIDRIISRTVSWALVTVVIGGVYLAAVTLLTSATAAYAGESTLAVAASTLLAAAAFGPVRRRIQSAVDRRFNRARYNAAQTVESYRVRLRDDIDVSSISTHLQAAVATTLQPSTSTLWLRTPEGQR